MNYRLVQLSVNDEKAIYDMLHELPMDENGYINSVCGKSYEEYEQWLKRNEDIQ